MANLKDLTKDDDDDEAYSMDEINPLRNNLRTDVELFKEEEWEDGKKNNTVIRIKRTARAKSESWKILENNKLAILIDGKRFTNKEKEFLRTADGFNYLINGYKQGWRSINKFKQNLQL